MSSDRGKDGRYTSGGKTSKWMEKEPGKAAQLIALAAEDPEATIKRLAKDCGLTPYATGAILQQMRTRWQPISEEIERVTTTSLVALIEEKLPILLKAITQGKAERATVKDLAFAFSVLAEKRQLLKGEPTQIMTYEERKNINHLLPDVLKEAQRRGLIVDATFKEMPDVQVLDPDVLPDAALSKAAAAQDRRKRAGHRR